jgi:hypothetical protein
VNVTMSDKTFEWVFMVFSIIAVLLIVLGSIFLLEPAAAIIVGFAVWIAGGGALLYWWGKAYMNKL